MSKESISGNDFCVDRSVGPSQSGLCRGVGTPAPAYGSVCCTLWPVQWEAALALLWAQLATVSGTVGVWSAQTGLLGSEINLRRPQG